MPKISPIKHKVRVVVDKPETIKQKILFDQYVTEQDA